MSHVIVNSTNSEKKKVGRNSSRKYKLKQRKKVSGKVDKPKNMKDNQRNQFASFVNKDEFSSNWKNFKQNLLHMEKDNVLKIEKSKHNYRKKKPKEDKVKETTTTPKNLPVLGKIGKISDSENKKRAGKIEKIADSENKEWTKIVAIDCEMVGIDTGKDSMLARVSIVNKFGNCIYDKYVLPSEPVVDYRTHVSGIRPKDLRGGESFEVVQKEVSDILQGRILVGHAIRNDLKVLYLGHPRRAIRDTSRYKPFRKVSKGGTPSLKKLAEELLGLKIQQGEHDSVIDARTAMQLYLLYRKEWEKSLHSKSNQRKP